MRVKCKARQVYTAEILNMPHAEYPPLQESQQYTTSILTLTLPT